MEWSSRRCGTARRPSSVASSVVSVLRWLHRDHVEVRLGSGPLARRLALALAYILWLRSTRQRLIRSALEGLRTYTDGVKSAFPQTKGQLDERAIPMPAECAGLLESVRELSRQSDFNGFGGRLIGMDVVLRSPGAPPSDATNYLGGIADVLEEKAHRGQLDHLGELAMVALFDDDRQVREVHFRHVRGPEGYAVRLWAL